VQANPHYFVIPNEAILVSERYAITNEMRNLKAVALVSALADFSLRGSILILERIGAPF